MLFSLCCNGIADSGAKDIAEALKVNRTLRELKLALNNISNEGGLAILQTLIVDPNAPSDQNPNLVLKLLEYVSSLLRESLATCAHPVCVL